MQQMDSDPPGATQQIEDVNNNRDDSVPESEYDKQDPVPPVHPRGSVRRTSSCQALRHAVLTLHRIDDFNMCKIGSGFFSEVFKVTHKTSGDIMVLKMNTSDDNRPNMLREVQLMNRMSHSNILKFMGVCVHEGQLHALTEYINGGSLHDILCADLSENIHWTDRVQIAHDVASGMKYLHSKGIFHRDLTSRNVLVDNLADGALLTKRGVVGDFGLATKIPDPSREIQLSIVGSPYWMAPECIKGQHYNEIADVFSFGIILCETIGRIDADPDVLPRTQTFGLDYIAFSELLDDSDCPLQFLYLAFRCCQMEPKKRPPFTELCDSLVEIKNSKVMQRLSAPVCSSVGGAGPPLLNFYPQRLSFYNQRSCSEQTLDFLKTEEPEELSPTAQFIGHHMTKEDPLYEPAPAHTNPFASNAQLSTGRKIVASDLERQRMFELSMTLPVREDCLTPVAARIRRLSRPHSSYSLPDSPGLVQRAIAQFNSQIATSQQQRFSCLSPMERLFSSDYASADSSMNGSVSSHDYLRQNSKQRNLECAMLFCGLDLIQMQRASSSEWSDTHLSTDLESEFQDDLEDVLRQSKWDSEEASVTLSPTPADSAFSDADTDCWFTAEQADPVTKRYLHPTLIEKRKQLRRVESRQKEKLEQLQQKLEQLRITASESALRAKRQSRQKRSMSTIT